MSNEARIYKTRSNEARIHNPSYLEAMSNEARINVWNKDMELMFPKKPETVFNFRESGLDYLFSDILMSAVFHNLKWSVRKWHFVMKSAL